MKRALVVTLSLAVALGAVWWLRHRGEHDGTDPHADHRRSTSLPNLADDRASPSEAPEPSAPLADDDPRGTLRLEGMVLGADDHPVAGATVTLAANPPRSATTEADGGFFFDGLVGRPYTLVARGPAGVAGPVTTRLSAKTEPIVLRLRAGGKLAVTVVGVDARPIDSATVELRGADRQTTHVTGGVAMFDPVVPGTYEVVAWATGMAKAQQEVRVTGATKARLVLAAGAPVAGRVVDADGAPVAGARVAYVASGDFAGRADPRLDGVTSAGDGSWRFAALPAGSFRFVANDSEHAPGTSTLITLDGATEKAGVVVTMARGAVVRGRVIDTAKRPVEGARVRIATAVRGTRGGARQAPRQTYSDAQGEFVIRGLVRGPLLATAAHDIGASTGVDVDTTSGDANVVITLDLTGVIAGTVVDPLGQPVESAQVTAFPQVGGFDLARARGALGQNVELTDANGRFWIGGLAVGTYTVRASRSAPPRGFGGRGRRTGDGVDADTGNKNVRIVLPAEGAIKGKVAFTDGTAPTAFTISVGPVDQAFVVDEFALDSIPPGDYTLSVRGPSFEPHEQDITIEPGKTIDVGTITVAAGRRIAGTVVRQGQPIAGATVYAGRQVMGGGSTNNSPTAGFGGFGASPAKQDTTDASGAFALAGFGDGDLAVIADLPAIGRSKPMLVGDGAPNQTSLVLELQPYGALSGVLRQGGQPVGGILVTVQSTSTPGAVYVVMDGADGAYRFDRLAPDTYKVSATVGTPRRGIHFYSQQIDVPPGKEVTVDLVVDAGTVTVDVTPVAASGQVGMAIAYLASGVIAAASAHDLSLRLAAAGPGTSQMTIARAGAPAAFTEVTPGTYSACVVPMPLEIRGGAAIGYLDRHGSKLPAFCKPVEVTASPDTQQAQITVVVPALIPDPQTGSGRGGTRGGSPDTPPRGR